MPAPSSTKRYAIKECFYTLQGEGVRAGTSAVFLRFAGCNLDCRKQTHGFDCDTDFAGGERLTADQIVERVADTDKHNCSWIVLTGGEPALQVDEALIASLKRARLKLAIETNGTIALPPGLDWTCVSPKVPDEQLAQRSADEVKFVLRHGDPLPQTTVEARHYLLSPAFEVASKTDPSDPGPLPSENLRWCMSLCRDNPPWRLSLQQHKVWRIP